MATFTGIAFSPLLPWQVLAAFAGAALLVLLLALWRRTPGVWWRGLAYAGILVALSNPSVVEEDREALADVAVAVIDRSPSQSIGGRAEQAAQAEAALRQRLGNVENLDLRIVHAGAPDPDAGIADDGTRLFEALDRALADTPRERFAGAILVTDGQVHDIPEGDTVERPGPLHVLLTGEPGESDRRLVIEQAPSYGIVGQPLELTLRIDDPEAQGVATRLRMRVGDGPEQSIAMRIGESSTIPFVLEHAGPTVIDLGAVAGERELTLQNNRAAVVVNGVRDRLRVLLVSGEPHAGERTWRNLLKADPAVDLVHFTILRPPEKQDGTPIRELSLIAFPVRELFETKLHEFNLIIFDRYRRRGVLPQTYYQNIADYVAQGGALLEASGPAFATPFSLSRTALGDVLPGKPTGDVYLQGFRPLLTEHGRRHPVTADLPGSGGDQPEWGRWFRQVDVEAGAGTTLLSGYGDRPLLLLERVGKGRVAQVLSDQIWLWARGFEGGGPQAELLRRLAHWLMKEPELEEEVLRAELRGTRLEIVRRSMEPDASPVVVTTPSGNRRDVTLREDGGRGSGSLVVNEPGLYRLSDGKRTAIAAVGSVNPREFDDVRASEAALAPLVQASGGGARWLARGMPDIRMVPPGRATEGRNWLGLVDRDSYVVTGVRQIPLLPALAVLALALGGLLLAWRREGR